MTGLPWEEGKRWLRLQMAHHNLQGRRHPCGVATGGMLDAIKATGVPCLVRVASCMG
jgi:hypothetical protein